MDTPVKRHNFSESDTTELARNTILDEQIERIFNRQIQTVVRLSTEPNSGYPTLLDC
jgi:hypothetical protein